MSIFRTGPIVYCVTCGLNKSSPFSRAVKMAISISCWPSEAVRKTVICYSTKRQTVWNACNSILLLYTTLYTTVQKFVDSKFFLLKEVSYVDHARLHLFDQKYSKSSDIVKYYYNVIFFLKWWQCWISSRLLLQSYDPSEIIIISNYYQCWKQLCCLTFLWKLWYIFFSDFFDK